jgi:hypothetical protein
MAGKKDFGAVPTKPRSVQDFMGDDTQPTTPAEPLKPSRKEPKAEKLAKKWGAYTVQRGYRLPIALLEALQGYVAERQEEERKYTETQAVCEAVTKFLADQGVNI